MRGSVLGSVTTAAAIGLLGTLAQAAGPSSAHLARGTQGVFWFMHISDLHTSCEWNPTDEMKNQEFALGEAVQVIKPWFVVATGDLVDASPGGIPTMGQSQAEWDQYKQSYTNAGMTPDFYFDLPGNHDGYGDIDFPHYLANSLQGSTNHDTYVSWSVDTPVGSYLFFGLDSAGVGSGPISENPQFLPGQISAMQDGLAQNPDAQLVFVLAHHRISQPANSSQVIDVLKGLGGGFYIHGHVHEYDEYTDGDPGIVVNEVNSLGQTEANNVAVGVVDHNAFVYRATGSKDPWPMVMITAPVSTTLRNGEANPYAYAVCKDRTDNPVRALVFGAGDTTAVRLQIGTLPVVAMNSAGQPPNLWAADVDTTALPAGPQKVTVSATVDGKEGSHTITAQFVDGPCDALPQDPPVDPGTDGGVEGGDDSGGAGGSAGGESDSGTAGASGGGAAGSGGGPSAGGQSGAAGADAGLQPSDPPAVADGGGCACRAAGPASWAGWWPAAAIAAAFGAARRSRRNRAR